MDFETIVNEVANGTIIEFPLSSVSFKDDCKLLGTLMGKPATVFCTFWGLNLLRKPKSPHVKKSFIERMFGWMMPKGAKKFKLSKMNMAGMVFGGADLLIGVFMAILYFRSRKGTPLPPKTLPKDYG